MEGEKAFAKGITVKVMFIIFPDEEEMGIFVGWGGKACRVDC